MATFGTLSRILAIVAISPCLPTMVEGGTVTPPPVAGFTTTDSSKDQVLLSASPSFTADLSTFNSFTGQVHSLLGEMFGPTGEGMADFEHQADDGPDLIHGDIALPYAMVGRAADGQNATVLYKFVVESGYQTAAGSTISADVYFRHDPLSTNQGYNAWIGVNPTALIPTGLYYLLNDADFQRVNMRDLFGPDSSGYASYTGEVSLDIPAGLTEFYVAFSDVFHGPGTPPTHSSARFAFTRLQIQANLVSAVIPGDYNHDGTVDAADYTVWRDNPGAFGGIPDGYNTWKTNFGQHSGSGAAAGTSEAVPEPCGLLLAVSGLGVLFLLRSKQAHIFHLR